MNRNFIATVNFGLHRGGMRSYLLRHAVPYGSFYTYLLRIKKVSSPLFQICAVEDEPEHMNISLSTDLDDRNNKASTK